MYNIPRNAPCNITILSGIPAFPCPSPKKCEPVGGLVSGAEPSVREWLWVASDKAAVYRLELFFCVDPCRPSFGLGIQTPTKGTGGSQIRAGWAMVTHVSKWSLIQAPCTSTSFGKRPTAAGKCFITSYAREVSLSLSNLELYAYSSRIHSSIHAMPPYWLYPKQQSLTCQPQGCQSQIEKPHAFGVGLSLLC